MSHNNYDVNCLIDRISKNTRQAILQIEQATDKRHAIPDKSIGNI